MIKKVAYINESTGEYVEKKYQLADTYNEKGYIFRKKSEIIKSFFDKPFPKELSYKDKGKLHDISYLVSKDQLLGYRSNNEIKPYTQKQLCEYLNDSESTFKRLFKKAKELNIIRKVKIDGVKWYIYNPIYKFVGKRINITTYIAFEDVLKEELPEWVINRFLEDMQVHDYHIEVDK